MTHANLDVALIVLLIIDLILTAYGVLAFTKSQKVCKEMLNHLVANRKH